MEKENLSRKAVAAMSAVMAYLRDEEDAVVCCAQAMPSMPVESVQKPVQPPNMWGMNGRQAQMQMRNLMQWKAFHGGRNR